MKQVAICRTAMLQLAQGIFNQRSKIMLAYWQRRKQFRLIKHTAKESLVQLFSCELRYYFVKKHRRLRRQPTSNYYILLYEEASTPTPATCFKNYKILICEEAPTPPPSSSVQLSILKYIKLWKASDAARQDRGKRWFTFITLSCMETRRISRSDVCGRKYCLV